MDAQQRCYMSGLLNQDGTCALSWMGQVGAALEAVWMPVGFATELS